MCQRLRNITYNLVSPLFPENGYNGFSTFFFQRETRFVTSRMLFAFLGPVVQSIVSLTSSLRGQLVKCFTLSVFRLYNQIRIYFLLKK